ncbi:hypothetical protein EG328_007771 [Venturia inaequalis]|uniref:Uncharacterized protein n=1 Tax=Venturia inaequalis TaxID=5025 RepID=A0A8H3UCR2_VENIN|nr:hypothetical protein EG328_007771 [Venturia inaequalis]
MATQTNATDELAVTEFVNSLTPESLKGSDWTRPLCLAPSVIVIIGESMVLASVPSASQVRIGKEHLSGVASERVISALAGKTLPSTLFECTQIGQRCFLDAHIGMNKISLRSADILPTISQILQVYADGSSAGSQDLLAMYLRDLKRSAKICADESLKLKEKFDWWTEFTAGLLRGVVGVGGDVTEELGEIKQQKKDQCGKIAVVEREEAQADKSLQTQRDRERKSIATRDVVLGYAVSTGVAALAVLPALAAGSVILAAAASLDVRIAEERVEQQRKALQEAEMARVRLEVEMQSIQAKGGKLENIRKILLDSLGRLNILQTHVDELLAFFADINTHVEAVVDKTEDGGILDQIANAHVSDPADRIKSIDNAYTVGALGIKTRFLFMQKAAQTYSQISKQQIIPGFAIIDSVALPEMRLSNPQVSDRSKKLLQYKQEATMKIEKTVSSVQTNGIPHRVAAH